MWPKTQTQRPTGAQDSWSPLVMDATEQMDPPTAALTSRGCVWHTESADTRAADVPSQSGSGPTSEVLAAIALRQGLVPARLWAAVHGPRHSVTEVNMCSGL